MATSNYQAKKYHQQGTDNIVDALTIEEALQINVNGDAFTITMRTPGDDLELVRGLLHAENIISDAKFTPDIVLRKEHENGVVSIVDVKIPKAKLGSGYTNSRSLLSVSSCGICGKTELEDLNFIGKVIDSKELVTIDSINHMFNQMNRVQEAFKQSGGCHASAAFDVNGILLSSKEDIGRHNAVDKVIGELLLNNDLKTAKCITVSGRISYEIIVKTFKAKIPILCAVSAPSSLAVDYAKELGITLLAFCREGRATCYAHPWRIKNYETSIKAG